MGHTLFCQSCSMPLDSDAVKGTEKDGSLSNEYCKHCYENGAFTAPDLTMDGMIEHIKIQIEKMNVPATQVKNVVENVSDLKRWKRSI